MSVYLHFPFCRNICSFCNYETRLIDRRSAEAWAANASREIHEYFSSDDFSGANVRSLFFGGGTASLIPTDVLCGLIETIASINTSGSIPEITLECEPGTIDRRRLEEAREGGVNRIGVCAQSFDDDMLRTLTRRHTSRDAIELVEAAVSVGIENLHLDLMYGLPGQDLEQWQRTLGTALELPFKHVSAYKLYVFLHGQIHRDGTAPRPTAEQDAQTELQHEMHDVTIETLRRAGLEQYSLTEYAQPGWECDYLVRTFAGGDVLPIGPSSFGRAGNEVWQNSGMVQSYSDAEGWSHARTAYRLSPAEALKRDAVLGLWLLRVDLEELAARHDVTCSRQVVELLDLMRQEGMISGAGSTVVVDPEQRFAIGDVMQRLATLDASDWVVAETTSVSRAQEQPPVPESAMSILRIARRDPAFFKELSTAPGPTLDALEHTLSPVEEARLLQAIASQDDGASTSNDPLDDAWRSTRREMQRRSRQAV